MRFIIDIDRAALVMTGGKPHLPHVIEGGVSGSYGVRLSIHPRHGISGEPEQPIEIHGDSFHIITFLREAARQVEHHAALLVAEGQLSADWDSAEAHERHRAAMRAFRDANKLAKEREA